MASFLGLCYVVLIAAAAAANIAAAASRELKVGDNMGNAASHQFKVGDNMGWSEPGSNETDVYNQWASKNRFQVGDSLYFEYKNDSVLVVDKEGYYHCITINPISSFINGKTIIKLDEPGPFYFISGISDHCKNGQRLIVDVLAPHPSHHPGHHPDWANAPSPSPLSSSAITTTMASAPSTLLAVTTLTLLFLESSVLQ